MKSTKILTILVLALGLVVCPPKVIGAAPMGTAFTYQGRLIDANNASDGLYDFQFKLFDGPNTLTAEQMGVTIDVNEMDVIDGYFTVELDFGGGVFDGNARWLEISARPGELIGPDPYTTLSPRQALTPAPYALFAPLPVIGGFWSLTGNAGTNPATNFLGTTDNQALELRANNLRILRLEPDPFSPNLIGGYSGNNATSGVVGATIGGGGNSGANNRVTDDFGTISGGKQNQAGNNSGGPMDASGPTIGGGRLNSATSFFATISGGLSNQADGEYSTVGGGEDNMASANWSAIGGGQENQANANYATIGGGGPIDPFNPASFGNRVFDEYGTVGGGAENRAGNDDGTSTLQKHATVGGGWSNTASGAQSTVGGGFENTATGLGATVAGGRGNEASSSEATVGGGRINIASSVGATVGGGEENEASAVGATVSGGEQNTADIGYTTVSGGQNNLANAQYATVPGGHLNTAAGDYSFAAGRQAKANHNGTFVWADSTDANFASTANDQFLIRASGGVGIGTNAPTYKMQIEGGGSPLLITAGGIAWPKFTFDVKAGGYAVLRLYDGNNEDFRFDTLGDSWLYGDGNVGIGTKLPASRLHVAGGCITGSMCSDIRLKKNIEPLPDDSILDRVMGLQAVTFEWKHRDDGKMQIGLIAQDVEEVFPEVVTTPDDGSCEKGLLATGMDAVLVEAIKELKAENELLRERLEILERRMDKRQFAIDKEVQ
ncbi:MAG: tail fiber domain-containing protein [Planctomycetota bacterium]|jgi:hypothetical protein